MHREISYEDQEWFLHTHGQKFAEAKFAELEDQPCTPVEDAFLTLATVLLMLCPVLAVIAFMVA
jgi:hypothetical protein